MDFYDFLMVISNKIFLFFFTIDFTHKLYFKIMKVLSENELSLQCIDHFCFLYNLKNPISSNLLLNPPIFSFSSPSN